MRCRKTTFYIIAFSSMLFYLGTFFMNCIIIYDPDDKYYSNRYQLESIRVGHIIILTSIFIIMILLITMVNLIEDIEIKKLLVDKLVKLKEHYKEENKRLKKNKEIPAHLKMILVKHFIENTDCNCPICLEKINIDSKVFLTFCGHLYHNECLIESLDFSDKCPYCRFIIDYDDDSDD